MKSKRSKVVIIVFVLFAVISLFSFLRITSQRRVTNNVFVSIVRAARHNEYEENVINQIICNLHETIPKEIQDKLKTYPQNIESSIQSFMGQFKSQFHSTPAKNKSFCNWFSWLLIKMVKDEPVLLESKMRARAQFEEELAGFCQLYQDGFEKRLGDKYQRFERDINNGIDWLRKALLNQYLLLQKEQLLSSFKRPLPDNIIEQANIKILEMKAAYPLYEESSQMMILDDEVYQKKIVAYITSIPNLWLSQLIGIDMITEIRTDGYLVSGDYLTLGQTKGALWPVAIWF